MLLSSPRPPRAVLVTGASSGIGRCVAVELAKRGDSLVLLARRGFELEQVARECRLQGAEKVVAFPADVTDESAVQDAFEVGRQQLGGLTTVVHAAAVAAYGRFQNIPAEVFDRVIEVNVGGTANVVRTALRHFDEADQTGEIVLFGSVVGRISTPFLSPYVASKWAVRGLGRSIQAEQAAGRHRVSMVEPGGVDTGIYEKAASFLGVQGKPPPPVADAQRVARATVAVLDRPRRELSIGALNPVLSLGFRVVPAVYDRLVVPLVNRLALADQPVADHHGNLFESASETVEREKGLV